MLLGETDGIQQEKGGMHCKERLTIIFNLHGIARAAFHTGAQLPLVDIAVLSYMVQPVNVNRRQDR